MLVDCAESESNFIRNDHIIIHRNSHTSQPMDVLSSKPISDRDAAKLLRKFVAAKENEDNGDLMVRASVDAPS